MSVVTISSGNIAGIPQYTKHRLLDIYTRANAKLRPNNILLYNVPNINELFRTNFIMCLNAKASDNIKLYCLSNNHDIYAFCFIRYKGILNNNRYYRLSFLTVNPQYRGAQLEKILVTKIISELSNESACIYAFVPKAFKLTNAYFDSLYQNNELSSSSEEFPEDPTSWLDDNAKSFLPLNSWNCFWYPKRPI